MKTKIYITAIFILITYFYYCNSTKPNLVSVKKAKAEIMPKSGTNVFGSVTFTQIADNSIKIVVSVVGLKPGKHGFHIHEKGDCSSNDGESALGHWNPDKLEHSVHDKENSHAGDLGNITANHEGSVFQEIIIKNVSLSDTKGPVGKALIIHADEDNLKTQPDGNSGKRIACGIIRSN
ncbi:MAG: superoxide dismutase family protein [Spirochaetia bacterium]|nr:superoxide dismutase family protein [Spirochaetia bacterium]